MVYTKSYRSCMFSTWWSMSESECTGGKKATGFDYGGNPEGVGFAEQVGGASASASKEGPHPTQWEGKGGQEESTPPGFVASVKSKLGLGTSADEAKQNRGGGVGVTGTGKLPFEKKPQGQRSFHSSVVRAADRQTRGQAPETSKKPKERTNAEQNPHLKHKTSSTHPDEGKGNAGETPQLPSHQVSGYMRYPATRCAYM